MSESNYTEIRFRNLKFLGFPNHAVGTDASIWSKAKRWKGGKKWKRMKINKWDRYCTVVLTYKGIEKTFGVAGLVLLAFVGPKPEGMVIRHFPDRNIENNCLENLSYGTPKQNGEDMVVHGMSLRGEKNPKAKLTKEEVLEIRQLYATGRYFQKDLGKRFGVGQDIISSIHLRKIWKHI